MIKRFLIVLSSALLLSGCAFVSFVAGTQFTWSEITRSPVAGMWEVNGKLYRVEEVPLTPAHSE